MQQRLQESHRYPANDSLSKLTLLLGKKKKKNNRHLLEMSQSHLESPSATGGGGKMCLKWQCFVWPVLPPTITWTGLLNFKWDSSLMSAAVISPWFCVSQHYRMTRMENALSFPPAGTLLQPGSTRYLLHCWCPSLFNIWLAVCTGRECCYLNRADWSMCNTSEEGRQWGNGEGEDNCSEIPE